MKLVVMVRMKRDKTARKVIKIRKSKKMQRGGTMRKQIDQIVKIGINKKIKFHRDENTSQGQNRF